MDEMKSEDAETRINAMKRLCIVAEALGPERTRKDLIGFLSGSLGRSKDGDHESAVAPYVSPLFGLSTMQSN